MTEGTRTSARERLVDATRELLWQHGYSGTTPSAIRARSDVGQGSMYHHFPTKADLAAEALRVSSAEAEQEVDGYLSQSSSPADGVARYLTKPRDGQVGCRFGRLTLDEAVLTDERLRVPVAETLTWYRQRVERLLREGQASGELRPDFSAEAVGATVLAIVQGAHILARADRSQASYERVIEGALTLLRGLESEA